MMERFFVAMVLDFVVYNGVAKVYFSASGTWKFGVPNQKTHLTRGNYFGISVLSKIDNLEWV
jgi:hypothetical protein